MVARWELALGFGLDLLLGDPRRLPHPVRAFGVAAERLEPLWRATKLPLRVSGALFWLTSVSLATAAVWATQPWANVYWIYALLALRDLDTKAAQVIRLVHSGDLEAARQALSLIVGRDTKGLDESEIVRAIVETVSENLSDAVIAPLFYLTVAGPAGMAAYKAVNTLDSMCGYRNERYQEFGWASARLDDVANFIPARITVVLVWIAAGLLGLDTSRSARVTLRDAATQPSPNAGYPEAAFAGALGVRLGGVNYYGGLASSKSYLGDPVRALTPAVYAPARRLLYGSALLAVAAALLVLPR